MQNSPHTRKINVKLMLYSSKTNKERFNANSFDFHPFFQEKESNKSFDTNELAVKSSWKIAPTFS